MVSQNCASIVKLSAGILNEPGMIPALLPEKEPKCKGTQLQLRYNGEENKTILREEKDTT